MRNSKGVLLQQPYLDLAQMRWQQKPCQPLSDMLLISFAWSLTNEGHFFWFQVYDCETPDIPASSLAELDAWRREQQITKMPSKIAPAEPDWKAEYEQLEAEANELTAALKELGAKYDELKAGDPSSN